MQEILLATASKLSAAWVDGTELIAWDSAIFKPGGFTDYAGNPMGLSTTIASTVTISPQAPYLANESFKYGKCINLGNGSVYTTSGRVAPAAFAAAWSLDYWHKDSIALDPANQYSSVCPLRVYPTINVGTWTNRILLCLCYGSTKRRSSFWNNQAAPRVTGAVNADPAFSTDMIHVAVTYDGAGHIRWFINGVLIETLTWTIVAPTGTVQVGPGSYAYLNTPRAEGLIERYRFRAGVKFAATGFDVSTIYPA